MTEWNESEEVIDRLLPLEDRFPAFSQSVAWVRGAEAGLTFTCDPAEVAEALIGLAMYG